MSTALERALGPSDPKAPLDRLATEWLMGRRLRSEIGARTADVMYSRLRPLLDLHGDFPVEVLDRATLLRWQAKTGRHAPATRRLALSAVRQFCGWLIAEGHLATDPTAGLPRIREPRTVPRALPVEDVAAVLDACPDARMRAIVLLMVQCGLRCGEIAGLDHGDWDRHAQTIEVTGKGGHERVLPVPGPAGEALAVYVGSCRGAGPLFRTELRGRHTVINRITSERVSELVADVMVDAGVHVQGDGRSAHALRHTAASDVLDVCHDVRVVQEMLGHQSIATTQRYLRRADLGRLREAMGGREYRRAWRRAEPGGALDPLPKVQDGPEKPETAPGAAAATLPVVGTDSEWGDDGEA